jgi:hypothetical protein
MSGKQDIDKSFPHLEELNFAGCLIQFKAVLRELDAMKLLASYAKIMKACRLNPKTKLLCESDYFKTANEILVRLRQRFHSVDETLKAFHRL